MLAVDTTRYYTEQRRQFKSSARHFSRRTINSTFAGQSRLSEREPLLRIRDNRITRSRVN